MKKIIAITGPSGAGKSAVAKALCKKFEKCVRIDIDRIKHFVETGFLYDDTPEGRLQWSLCVKNVIQLAQNFQAGGYIVVIEGYLSMESPGWEDIFRELSIDLGILLLPSEEVLRQRNETRDICMQMENSDIKQHLNYFVPRQDTGVFISRDTSGESIEETAQWILSKIERE